MLRRQAEALETAGRTIEETDQLMKAQAELAKETVGLDRRVRKGGRQSRP